MKKMFLICLIILSGCNLAPKYRRPCVDPPMEWRVPSDTLSTLANERFWEWLSDPILNGLILQALNNNRDLMVAAWRVIEYYGQFLEVQSQLFPQVGLDALALKEKFSESGLLPAALRSPITPFYSFDFTFSYEIDLWGQLRNQTKAAWGELLAQIENRRTVVLSLCSAVAEGYVLLRQLDRQLQISYQTLEARREAMELAWERFHGGLTSEIEVTQSISLFDAAQAAVVNLEQQIPVQENLLSILVGANPTCVARGRELSDFTYPPVVPAGIPSEVLQNRPDIVKAEDLLIASNAEIGVARAAFFPQITLTGLWGGQSLQLKKLFSKSSRMWQIGGTLFQPLFTGGYLTGQLVAAIAQNKEAYFSYEQTVLNAFKEVDDALVSHEQAKKLVTVEEDRVKDLKVYLELSWLRYYEGQTEYITVLNASTELFNEELALAAAQGNLFKTLVDIYKAVGGGWVLDADCNLRQGLGEHL